MEKHWLLGAKAQVNRYLLTVIRGLPLRFKINELYQSKHPKTFALLLNRTIANDKGEKTKQIFIV
jgi:hypothetical protein